MPSTKVSWDKIIKLNQEKSTNIPMYLEVRDQRNNLKEERRRKTKPEIIKLLPIQRAKVISFKKHKLNASDIW